MTAITPSEHAEQCVVVEWFNTQHPRHCKLLVASANGAHIAGTPKQRAVKITKLKRAGMKTGFPDLLLLVPQGGYHGMAIEMKRRKRSTTDDKQLAYIELLNAHGYFAVLCKGAESAIEMITAYMGGRIERE